MPSKSTLKYPFPPQLLERRKPMEKFIGKYWRLNRSAVSPDTDRLIAGIKREIPEGTVLEARSGEEVLGGEGCPQWEVPCRWVVRKGQLKATGGEILADFAENPLLLWMHCIGFQGRVSREELLKHVESDPERPDDVRFRYRNGYRYKVREWGFSLPHKLVESLTDGEYDVEIDADLDEGGSLKVFNAFLPGRLPDTVFFMAHTCHPAQVADGLANIAVLVELYRHLAGLPGRQYSYRFLFGPEYFGAAAYLGRAPQEEVANLRWGLFCDMLSAGEPLGWQPSFRGDSKLDAVLQSVIPYHSSFHIERPYRKLWGNDEMFYNGPGFEIPAAAVGRGHNEASPREYHYDSDTPEAVDGYHLVESLWILQRIAEVFETDRVPVRNFKGPVRQDRYKLYADATAQKGEYDLREAAPILMDGKRSLLDIARELGADFFAVRDFARRMEERGLVEITPLAGP